MYEITNVFIVDDSPTDVKVAEAILAEYNFTIHTFTNPLEAFENMAELSPGLIILD